MAVLTTSIRNQLRGIFDALPQPVTLVVFGHSNETGCESCAETRGLMQELASVGAAKVRVETIEIDIQPELAKAYQIENAPAVAVLGGETGRTDFGIRFVGTPAGYEFATLIEDIRMASTGNSDLGPATSDALAHLTTPLHFQVFVTPTCPYCPRAVLLAHKLAVASPWITAAAIDAVAFPELADRYQVQGVPKTVINDALHIEGAVPEPMLLAQLLPLIESA